MFITLIAVGRMQRGPEQDLVSTYQKRLPWRLDIHEIDIKKPAQSADERKAREAERILAAVPDGAVVIALDERGKHLSSRDLAKKFDGWSGQGFNSLAVIIGGADGLDESVRQRADLTLALGTLTWPHMLVRAMIAEQLYRVWSITAGHPYHRD
ncbi:23S rRNA (pseudouridine(1915)-N(3))-methyltransferase RlmH [Pseudokordiimonas caeni]|uniref:23S rRNA (pseudouridine(1915)-N(3))-methyltransferase RlmH n=1 Tax=Pseudokordiimonas caeni TaxID=2997908 RepID=UPI0028117562|nr:23S rRNA (pseudouridine(1915)-N(3))-methyltransferase RlmH [Pseudokordiimonas caeni]